MFIFVLILLTFFSAVSHAQSPSPLWESALPVCESYGKVDQQNPVMIKAKTGGYFIVFEDKRSGKNKLYAQHIDEAGNILWENDAIAISKNTGNQSNAKIIASKNGSFIVVWQDDSKGNLDIFAQRINNGGALLFGPSGIEISSEEKNQIFPEITTDSNGGAIICWQDLRHNNEDIFAQRIDQNGNLLFKANGIAITSLQSTQWLPKIASDHKGGAIVAWTDRREGNYDLYAQRIGPDGKLYWQENGKKAAGSAYSEEDPSIVTFDNGSSAIAYRIKNNGIFLQYINSNGDPLLGENGKQVSRASAPSAPQIARGNSNESVIVWSDSFAGDADIYSQRIDQSGNFLWGEKEYPLVQIRGVQEKPQISGQGPWVVAWLDSRSGRPEIYCQQIGISGLQKWKKNGKRICRNQKEPENINLLENNSGEAILCFQDKRKGNYDIFAQKIDTTGETAWSYDGLLVNASRGKTAQKNIEIINDGSDNYIFAFEDYRSGLSNIILQKVSSSGRLLWSQSGIPAAFINAKQKNPKMTSDGAGGVIVTWEDYRNPEGPKIFAQRISSKGSRSWNKLGINLTKPKGYSEQTKPQIASDGKYGAIIVWEENRGDYNAKDIFATRLNSKGKALWRKTIATGGADQSSPQISPKKLIVVWSDNRIDAKNSDIYAQRLTLSGKTLWQEDGIAVCQAPDLQRDPQIIDTLISWTDKGGGSFDIYAQKIDKYGSGQWVKDGIAIAQSARSQQGAKMTQNTIVWEDFRQGNWDIYAQSFDSQGNLLWREGGKAVASLPGTQYNPQIKKAGNFNLISWEDYRNEKNYAIYIQMLDSEGKNRYPTDGKLILASKDGGRFPKLAVSNNQSSFIVTWEDYRFGMPAVFAQRYSP